MKPEYKSSVSKDNCGAVEMIGQDKNQDRQCLKFFITNEVSGYGHFRYVSGRNQCWKYQTNPKFFSFKERYDTLP